MPATKRSPPRVEAAEPLTETPDDLVALANWGGKLLFLNRFWFSVVRTDWLVITGPQPHVPYRPGSDPWYPYFEMASDDKGRLVTSKGDVVSPSFQIERHVVDDADRRLFPLWVGPTPAFLVRGRKTGELSLVWADPRGVAAP